MPTVLDWPWGRTLARVEEGEWVEVDGFLYDAIRDELREMGIRRGSALECVGTEPLSMHIALPDGRAVELSRAYAWFVRVKRSSRGQPSERGRRSGDHDAGVRRRAWGSASRYTSSRHPIKRPSE